MFSESLIEEVRSGNDIVDVISGYVRLQKKGSEYVGLCPFHNEKTPSFYVSREKQLYYCFGCGAGGNVFTFLEEYENDTFQEAMATLAGRIGISLPAEGMDEGQRHAADRKMRLLEVNKEAAKYYYGLLRSERGKRAYEYFQGRGLSEETCRRFGLGYSDKYSDDLYRYLRHKGYPDELLKDSGLVSYDETHGGRDKFWNRAMFPIMDVRGRVIGFGGRVMGEGEPKYLNSPETMIFDKGRTLYGLHLAKSSRKKQILLCEGYMDVIALHQAGFDNAVAALGTAFTPGHANLLRRYTKEVYLTFDSDGAGVRAAKRAIPILQEAGISTKVVHMEPYKDPDEFIKALGKEAYQERIDQAQNSFLFEIHLLEEQYDLKSPDGKTDFCNAAARELLRFPEEIERNAYVEAVAETYGIGVESLKKLVNRLGAQGVPAVAGAYQRRPERRPKVDGMKQSQKLLLTWIAEDVGLFHAIDGLIGPLDFTDPFCQKTAGLLFSQYHEHGKADLAGIVDQFAQEEQKEVASLFHASIGEVESEEDRKKAIQETIVRIKRNSIEHRSKEIDPTNLEAFQKIVEDKRQLESLKNLRIPDLKGAQ